MKRGWIVFSVFCICITFTLYCFSQNNQDRIDSLAALLEAHPQKDRVHADALLELYKQSKHLNDFERSKKIASEAIEIAQLLEYNDGKILGLTYLGMTLNDQNRLDSADLVLKSALELSNELEHKDELIKIYSNLGMIERKRGKYADALQFTKRAMDLALQVKDSLQIMNINNGLGNIYFRIGDYEKAIVRFRESLKLAKVINPFLTLQIKTNIGAIFQKMGNDEEALTHYELTLVEEENDNNGILVSMALTNMGDIYLKQNKPRKAANHYLRALKISERIGNEQGICSALLNLSSVYYSTSEFTEAINFLEQSLSISKKIGNRYYQTAALVAIGKNHLQLKNYNAAEDYLFMANKLAEEIGSKVHLNNSLKHLSELAERKEDYKLALDYFKQQESIEDSLQNTEKERIIRETEARYETAEKEKALQEQTLKNALLEKENAEVRVNALRQRNGFLMGLGGVLVLFMLILIGFRRRTKRFQKELMDLRELTLENQNSISPPLKKQDAHPMREERQEDLATKQASTDLTSLDEEEKEPEEGGEHLEEKQVDESVDVITSIPVKVSDKIYLIKPAEVIYFNAEDNYVFINDVRGKRHIIDHTLSSIEKRLPKEFVRIHRSYIVNKEFIKELRKGFNRNFIFLMKDEKGSTLTSSKKYADNVKELLKL